MVNCKECKKKLSILEGYRHPALGTKFLVCGLCYDKVNRNMERWSTFCLSDSFTIESSKISNRRGLEQKYIPRPSVTRMVSQSLGYIGIFQDLRHIKQYDKNPLRKLFQPYFFLI